MAKYKKVTKWERFKGWCSDHTGEIILGGMFVLGAIGGVVIGRDLGKKKGYRNAMRDVADRMPNIVDYCGKTGALADCNAIWDLAEESGHEEYLTALENLDAEKIGKRAYHNFYDDEGIDKFLKQMEFIRTTKL